MRYKIKLSYDGSPFCGWQIQPGSPSVQGKLEDALGMLLRHRTPVTGAGRTDACVNARGYVAHFDADEDFDCPQMIYKLNAVLPEEISIESIDRVRDDFHARFDAKKREYKYFLHRVKDPFAERFSYEYTYPGLDMDAMNRAVSAMVGTHDFSCFEKTGGNNRTSDCTVFEAHWDKYTPVTAASERSDDYMCFTMAADRFLRNMVRATVGTLLEVGRGKRTIGDFESLILDPHGSVRKNCPESAFSSGSSSDVSRRCLAGESVPGHALFLTRIEY